MGEDSGRRLWGGAVAVGGGGGGEGHMPPGAGQGGAPSGCNF